ncbi:unnamed protein product [Mesocestoides corti]|uniref:SCY domain-containing protein n=1 Tax=Mesocestoides corti TaxID=53468 RepID=A0A0R3UPV1_MESCO|nr:unnamed protein product [Mesocestoides corti]
MIKTPSDFSSCEKLNSMQRASSTRMIHLTDNDADTTARVWKALMICLHVATAANKPPEAECVPTVTGPVCLHNVMGIRQLGGVVGCKEGGGWEGRNAWSKCHAPLGHVQSNLAAMETPLAVINQM